ncbi:FIMAH domain-containing protein [Geomicrobium halophilum]|uniref:FIMAH domain-containing protein n=1 Tax=Geomicrobium halophilum TaxID=549000 RepID=UPI003CCDDE16
MLKISKNKLSNTRSGAFANKEAPHALLLHLTAISHYEDQKAEEKVLRHLGGLKHLLDNQKENDVIMKRHMKL